MIIDRAVIEVNGGCNYTCQMCPQGTKEGRGKDWLKKMPLADFERYLDEIKPKMVNLEGSGEPTLNFNLHEYIAACTKRGIKSYIFSNGFKMHGDYMKRCVDAGLTYYRFSVIGYDPLSYMKWMNKNAFHTILRNAVEMKEYAAGKTRVGSYHLILDPDGGVDREIELYQKNFIDIAGTEAEIWKMHNWSGVYKPDYARQGHVKTCGRPFSPDVVVRANKGAVHPCCQVMGNDDAAVLGYLSEQSLEEIWNGPLYEKLREDHRTGNYPDYCKSCDFLIEDSESLVWTNCGRTTYKMNGTEFDLEDFTRPDP